MVPVGGAAIVTSQMIYEKLLGVEATVHRIDTTLTELAKDSEDHEARIRTLEQVSGKLTGKLVGIAATLSVVGGAVVTFVLSQIGG